MYIHKNNCILSPHYEDEDGVFIKGKQYSSVAEYMNIFPNERLHEVLLAKFTQHIYYQKYINELKNAILYEKQLSWELDLEDAYAYVWEQLRPYKHDEVITSFDKWVWAAGPDLTSERLEFFYSAQPFVGRDKAMFFSLVWVNKKIYQCSYDKRVEKTLRSLTPNHY